jgi:hypothetical protein
MVSPRSIIGVPRTLCVVACCLGFMACSSTSPPVADTVDTAVQPTAPDVPPPVALLALTPTEFNNTIRDLLGFPMNAQEWPDAPPIAAQLLPVQGVKEGVFGLSLVDLPPWPWAFPEESGVEGFEGLDEGQTPSPYSVEEIQKATVYYAAYVLASPTFFTCVDWAALSTTEQQACGWDSLMHFAQRAWRRPVTDAETERLDAFWTDAWGDGSPEEAVVLSAAAILQSPSFAFRIEHGEQEEAQGNSLPLSDWEMASRLSYFVWDSMPDQALFDAAEAGELGTPEEVRAHAQRMLTDERARDAVVHFHYQWLGTNKVHTLSPARRAYGPVFGISPEPPLDTTGDGDWPTVLLPIRHSMDAETHLFLERTIFDGGGTLTALLTDNHGYMSSHTSPIYGDSAKVLNGPPVKWSYGKVINSGGSKSTLTLVPAEFDPGQRSGVLTLPSVLGLGAYAVHPAPILRGKMILERLACQEFGAPPQGAEAAAPADMLEVEGTNRIRTEQATAAPTCAGCHDMLNPPGFAFEHYDSMGFYRTEDNGLPVDASGTLPLFGGESFEFVDGVDLSHQLAASRQVRDCYSLRWIRTATGIQFHQGDEGIAAIQEHFDGNDRVKDLIVHIVGTDLFRTRRTEEAKP